MEILNLLIQFFTNYGYMAVFLVLVACGFGLPIPEDITLIAGGVICAISSTGDSGLRTDIMAVIALCGVLVGDSIMFIIGSKLGIGVTRVKGLKRIITKNTYFEIQKKVQKYGLKILFIARFLPGLRAPIFVFTGASHKVHFIKFLLMDFAAALISVPTLVYLGYFFANDLGHVLKWVKHSETLIIGVIIIIVVIIIVNNWYKNKKDTK